MIIPNIKTAKPQRNGVVVKLIKLDDLSFSTESKIAVRYAEVISLGQDVQDVEHCPGLQVGDTVVFQEYAGYYLPSDENELYKLVRGYDILGVMNEDVLNTKPAANRLMVEVFRDGDGSDGGLLSTDAEDPTEGTLIFGKIIKGGIAVKNKEELIEGAIVAFYPHVGTAIQEFESAEVKELKLIVEEDILLII